MSRRVKLSAFLFLNYRPRPKVRPHLHANTNKAGWGEAYVNICLDSNMRQNVVVRRVSEWFSLKYRFQADSVSSASDRTEAVLLSSVTHLHCYVCLVSACLALVFILMRTRLLGFLKNSTMKYSIGSIYDDFGAVAFFYYFLMVNKFFPSFPITFSLNLGSYRSYKVKYYRESSLIWSIINQNLKFLRQIWDTL